MNLFKSESLYDSKTGKFLEEFYINGESVDGDLYYFHLEREKDIEDKKLKGNPYEYDECETETECEYNDCICEGCCGECGNEYEDEQEVAYDELLDIFAEKIQNTGGSFEEIKCLMDEFADIVLEANEEEFCEDNDIYIDDEMDCGISEECIDCDDTECENQISSEELEELKIIASFTEEVLKRDGCPDCIFGLLGDLYVKGKNVGWQNHKDYIMMCNE